MMFEIPTYRVVADLEKGRIEVRVCQPDLTAFLSICQFNRATAVSYQLETKEDRMKQFNVTTASSASSDWSSP